VWVQLISTKGVEKAGHLVTYRPGDWCDVGKQTALEWVSDGSARAVDPVALNVFASGTGVFVRGSVERVSILLGPYAKRGEITDEPPIVHFDKTLVLKPTGAHPRLDTLGTAWRLLDQGWEAVIPLLDYNQLASNYGTVEERELTAKYVHDLRIPMYDPRVIFVRRCPAGEALIAEFYEEMHRGGEEPLALLRALHRVKPMVLATPRTWVDIHAHRTEQW